MILILWLLTKRCLSGYIYLRVMAILKALIMENLRHSLFMSKLMSIARKQYFYSISKTRHDFYISPSKESLYSSRDLDESRHDMKD